MHVQESVNPQGDCRYSDSYIVVCVCVCVCMCVCVCVLLCLAVCACVKCGRTPSVHVAEIHAKIDRLKGIAREIVVFWC